MELASLISCDDFIDVEAVKGSYEVSEDDLRELEERKNDVAKQLQEVLGSVFRQALEKANSAQDQHKEHLKRLQSKRRRTADDGEQASDTGGIESGTGTSASPGSATAGSPTEASVEEVGKAATQVDIRSLVAADGGVQAAKRAGL
eukprot:6063018-Pyramimonas_sp.AAC.1